MVSARQLVSPMAIDSQARNTVSYIQKADERGQEANTKADIECWCGNTPPSLSLFFPEVDKKCTFTCPADTTQACGGNGGFISVFYDSLNFSPGNSTNSTTQTPSVVPSVGAFSSVGCYTEATTGRALTGSSYANNNMTVESCAAFCGGFTWFGVEYARECKLLHT